MAVAASTAFRLSVLVALGLFAVVLPRPLGAAPADLHLLIPPPAEAAASPASRHAQLTNESALAELARRKIPFVVAGPTAGVRLAIRLTGPLHGVTVRSSLPTAERATTPYEILDARLAIALDDFAAVLANHGVVEVVHFTMYRPPGKGAGAAKTGLPRHPGGLAIDVGAFRKKNGTRLDVDAHWPAAIGARTCGRGARLLPGRRGRELVSLVCEAADLRLFHAILTPHFNRAHHDHLHLEIKPDTPWFLVH